MSDSDDRPVMLSLYEAALYVEMSIIEFRHFVATDRMPPPYRLRGHHVWRVDDLERYRRRMWVGHEGRIRMARRVGRDDDRAARRCPLKRAAVPPPRPRP